MELKTFIQKTLVEINQGLKIANKELNELDSRTHFEMRIGDKADAIEFDISVTISEEAEAGGSGGINVWAAKLNGETKLSGGREDISKIKFKIYPDLSI